MTDEIPPPQLPPAGWYPDPEGSGQQRFWDGANWSDQLAPPQQQAQQVVGGRVKDDRNNWLAAWGYLTAVLLPIVGIIIAIVLYNRNDSRGTPVLITSIVVIVVSAIIISSGSA